MYMYMKLCMKVLSCLPCLVFAAQPAGVPSDYGFESSEATSVLPVFLHTRTCTCTCTCTCIYIHMYMCVCVRVYAFA